MVSEAHKIACKKWRDNNKEKHISYSRADYEKNRGRYVQTARAWHLANYTLVMWQRAQKRAMAKNIDFNIDVDDIVIPEMCPVLNIPLEVSQGSGHTANSPSIDHIDNSKGYVKGNIRIISVRANKIKSDATISEIQQIYDYLLREGMIITGRTQ
jgi:hypothetical protein